MISVYICQTDSPSFSATVYCPMTWISAMSPSGFFEEPQERFVGKAYDFIPVKSCSHHQREIGRL